MLEQIAPSREEMKIKSSFGLREITFCFGREPQLRRFLFLIPDLFSYLPASNVR
jgi:hypothetical protein